MDKLPEIEQWVERMISLESLRQLLMKTHKKEETCAPPSNGWQGSKEQEALEVVKNDSIGENGKSEVSKRRTELGDSEMMVPTLMRVEIKPPRVALIPPQVEVAHTKLVGVEVDNENQIMGKGANREKGKRSEEFKLLERGKRKVVRGMRDKQTMSLCNAAKVTRTLRMSVHSEMITIVKSWRAELYRRLKDDGNKGCTYQVKLGEWHPTEELLKGIAASINRDGENDLSNTTLRKLLFSDITKFFQRQRS